MSTRVQMLESIVSTIKDYREGQIAPPSPEHVETWVSQFDGVVQDPILNELDHVLKKTYVSKLSFQEFFSQLLTAEKLVGDEPLKFWKEANFLDIQAGGNSQSEMLLMFGERLKTECGIEIKDCGKNHELYVYLDDAIFTGNRILNDFRGWLASSAPQKARVHIVTIALHRGGQYYAKKNIKTTAESAGKEISLTWWRCLEIEDQKAQINESDVLRPTMIPDEPLVKAYVGSMKFEPILRKPGSVGQNKFFSCEGGRHLMEQELLKAGAKIRDECPGLNKYQRPLGNMVLDTLGFGALVVTFRNCPNNCPLAFWAGDPWYPLFPRKTN